MFYKIYKYTMRVMIGFLMFMALAILCNLGQYAIDEIKNGEISWTPKGMKK